LTERKKEVKTVHGLFRLTKMDIGKNKMHAFTKKEGRLKVFGIRFQAVYKEVMNGFLSVRTKKLAAIHYFIAADERTSTRCCTYYLATADITDICTTFLRLLHLGFFFFRHLTTKSLCECACF